MTNPNEAAYGHGAENGHCCGLTKREHFAAMAMQGMVVGITRFRDDAKDIIVNRPKGIAEISLVYADALIAELSKEAWGK